MREDPVPVVGQEGVSPGYAVDLTLTAGGRPRRWLVQTWYPFPKRMAPETDPTTMTGLVKAVIERVRRAR